MTPPAQRASIASLVASLLLTAYAPALGAEPIAGDTRDGLPGLGRLGLAAPAVRGGGLAWTSGYGYTESVLDAGDAHHRLAGNLAGSLTIAPALAVAVRLDGRYDRHTGGDGDDGWIGDTRIIARTGHGSGRLHVGGQLVLWLPGDAPLVPTADGASAEALAMAGYAAAPALRLVGNLGFRLDRSAGSVPDADRLSDADRMALGVSDSSAVLLGLGALWQRGGTELYGEASWDLLVGADAPSAIESPIRIGAGARVAVADAWALFGGIEIAMSSRPPVGPDDALVPIEPRLAIAAGVRWRFGAPKPTVRTEIVGDDVVVDDEPKDDGGRLRGRIVTPDGRPLVGATVSAGDASTVTDDDGRFELSGLAPGPITLDIGAVPPYGATTARAVVGDDPTVADVTVERALPAGQIRGVVHTVAGAPVAARIRIEPLGKSLRAGADGAFRVDVPPGSYQVVIDGPGLTAQRRSIKVQQNGVTVLNVELRTASGGR